MRATRLGRRPGAAGVGLTTGLLVVWAGLSASLGSVAGAAGVAAPLPSTATPSPVPGPRAAYQCAYNQATDAFTGANGTASAIGWEGNNQGVVTCLGGTFVVQYGVLYQDFGFGLYGGQRTTWTDADGYLPAQITTFRTAGAVVSITEFADRVVIGGHAYVAVYARVRVANPTNHAVTADPDPSSGLVPIATAPDTVAPHCRPSTTTWWPPTGSASPTPGPGTRRWPAPAASSSTSPTCGASGTGNWPASPECRCPTPPSTRPIAAGSSPPRSPAAATP